VWNYTEMYSTSLRPAVAVIASLNQALTQIHLSMIHQWGEVQRDIIKHWTHRAERDVAIEQPGFVAASSEDTDAEAVETEQEHSDTEVPEVDEPAIPNAAMAILNNPALAAEAATRRADDAVDYEVRDDVADDIAAEIQREAQQEFNPPPA